MPEALSPSAARSLTEVKVKVPSDRVAGFYALVGAWLRVQDDQPVGVLGNGERPARRRASGVSKYAPLGDHLAKVDEEAVTLTFEEVEELLGAELPSSARRHRAWWANSDTHSQACAWLERGWFVSRVDLEARHVTFTRH